MEKSKVLIVIGSITALFTHKNQLDTLSRAFQDDVKRGKTLVNPLSKEAYELSDGCLHLHTEVSCDE